MKIEVLGTGCARCEQLYENARSAAAEFEGIEVDKNADIKYIAGKGVFMTPGFLIDGTVVSSGKLLSAEEIKGKIKERL